MRRAVYRFYAHLAGLPVVKSINKRLLTGGLWATIISIAGYRNPF